MNNSGDLVRDSWARLVESGQINFGAQPVRRNPSFAYGVWLGIALGCTIWLLLLAVCFMLWSML